MPAAPMEEIAVVMVVDLAMGRCLETTIALVERDDSIRECDKEGD